jgi:hypothetical protein
MAPDVLAKPGYLAEIEDLGYAYTEVAQYDVTKLSKDRRVQAREYPSTLKGFAPKDEVDRYAVAMAHSVFPPIIVTKDEWLADGNTRVGARLQRKEKFHPAIVLDVDYASLPTEEQEKVFALATTLNSANGKSLTKKERRAAIVVLIHLGWNNAQIERRVGIPTTEINKMRKVIDAKTRLTDLDVTANGNLSIAAQAALGDAKTLLLNDDPYKALASLVMDAGLNAGEVKTISKEILGLGSDTEKLGRLGAIRGEYKEQIESVKFSHSPKPPVARQLRQHLGYVLKYDGKATLLVERNGEYAQIHTEYIEKSIEILRAALAAQKEA